MRKDAVNAAGAAMDAVLDPEEERKRKKREYDLKR